MIKRLVVFVTLFFVAVLLSWGAEAKAIPAFPCDRGGETLIFTPGSATSDGFALMKNANGHFVLDGGRRFDMASVSILANLDDAGCTNTPSSLTLTIRTPFDAVDAERVDVVVLP